MNQIMKLVHYCHDWTGIRWINFGSGLLALGFRGIFPVRGVLLRRWRWTLIDGKRKPIGT